MIKKFKHWLNEGLSVNTQEHGDKKVNIFIGRFQPFTLGHGKVLEQLHKENGLPTIVFLIKSKKVQKDDNFKRPFDIGLQKSMLEKLKSRYNIEDIIVLDTAAIDKIFNALRPKYEPVLWGAGSDRIKSYGFQVNKQQYRDELNVLPDFSLYEIKRLGKNISATQVRNAILLGQEAEFKKLVPKELHDLYNQLKAVLDLKNPDYQIAESKKEIMRIVKTFEQFTEEITSKDEDLSESMGAFDGLSPIPAEYQRPTFDVIEKDFLKKVLKLKPDEYTTLGSTFKKRPGETSGDIDIAVNGLRIGSEFKLKFNEIVDKVYELLQKTFPNLEVNLTKGLGVTNIKFPQYNEKGEKTNDFVQIDFMVVDDIPMANFIYHSPDFTKDESRYKGLYRSHLIFDIVKNIDFDGETEYYEDEFGGKFKGMLKSFRKYTLTAHKGLVTQLKSFDGKRGRRKNASIIKGMDKFITKNIDDIAKFVLGPDATPMDLTSFESIYNWMQTDKFPHRHKFDQIIKDYKNTIIKKNMPLPSELED